MTKNTGGATEDLAADLAAVRTEVARLADTLTKLVQHQTMDRVRAARNEIEAKHRAQTVHGGADCFRHRNIARHERYDRVADHA